MSDFVKYVFGAVGGKASGRHLIGVLKGEGIGPEVIDSSLSVLSAVEEVTGTRFKLEYGGAIGRESERLHGRPLSEQVVDFCDDVFERGGAILSGPGGGRFVYDLRKRFNLFCKIVPIRSEPALGGSRILRDKCASDVDIVLIRENVGGLYQGSWDTVRRDDDGRTAIHTLTYTEKQVCDVLEVGGRIASERLGKMSVVWKESGIPAVSALWKSCATSTAQKYGVALSMIDVDYAAYWLLCDAKNIDVIVTPNLFGDILGDLAAVIPGSRGLTYSGNYTATGQAVYQTNHGAAYDLAGTDTANPVGQILSLVMMLRESFDLAVEAALIESAVRDVWSKGWRTPDLAGPDSHVVGTRKMTELICDSLVSHSTSVPQRETTSTDS